MIEKLGLSQKPKLLVFNKIDRVNRKFLKVIEDRYGASSISCVTEEGSEKLVQTIEMAVGAVQGDRKEPPSFQKTGG
jgi:50S ribosomal subunit-associated GTPase HflX